MEFLRIILVVFILVAVTVTANPVHKSPGLEAAHNQENENEKLVELFKEYLDEGEYERAVKQHLRDSENIRPKNPMFAFADYDDVHPSPDSRGICPPGYSKDRRGVCREIW